MKKKNLTLEKLKVTSFVTNVSLELFETIKGGTGGIDPNNSNVDCITTPVGCVVSAGNCTNIAPDSKCCPSLIGNNCHPPASADC